MGRYLWVDLSRLAEADLSALQSGVQDRRILFLTSSNPSLTETSEALLKSLLALPCRVWLSVYSVKVIEHEPLYFHQALAAAGKYLIEDVDEAAAGQVYPGGELIALPLRLAGVCGSPCRGVVIQD